MFCSLFFCPQNNAWTWKYWCWCEHTGKRNEEPSNCQTQTHLHKRQRRMETIADRNFINEHSVTWWLRWIRRIELLHHPKVVVVAVVAFFFWLTLLRWPHRHIVGRVTTRSSLANGKFQINKNETPCDRWKAVWAEERDRKADTSKHPFTKKRK